VQSRTTSRYYRCTCKPLGPSAPAQTLEIFSKAEQPLEESSHIGLHAGSVILTRYSSNLDFAIETETHHRDPWERRAKKCLPTGARLDEERTAAMTSNTSYLTGFNIALHITATCSASIPGARLQQQAVEEFFQAVLEGGAKSECQSHNVRMVMMRAAFYRTGRLQNDRGYSRALL